MAERPPPIVDPPIPPDEERCETRALDLGAVLAIHAAAVGRTAHAESRDTERAGEGLTQPTGPRGAALETDDAPNTDAALIAENDNAKWSEPPPAERPSVEHLRTLEVDYSPATRRFRRLSVRAQNVAVAVLFACLGGGLMLAVVAWMVVTGRMKTRDRAGEVAAAVAAAAPSETYTANTPAPTAQAPTAAAPTAAAPAPSDAAKTAPTTAAGVSTSKIGTQSTLPTGSARPAPGTIVLSPYPHVAPAGTASAVDLPFGRPAATGPRPTGAPATGATATGSPMPTSAPSGAPKSASGPDLTVPIPQ